MIVAVINEKGGVAKTTTAVNLATALSLSGQDVVLADIDTQADACLYAHEEYDSGITWRLSTPRTVKRCLEEEGLNPRGTSSDKWAVLDCPADRGPGMRAAFEVSSLILIPVDCRQGGLDGLKRINESFRAARRAVNPTLRLRVVFTIWHNRSQDADQQETMEDVLALFGGDVLSTRIRYSKMFERASKKKLPIAFHSPRSTGTEDYRQLAEEISKLCR